MLPESNADLHAGVVCDDGLLDMLIELAARRQRPVSIRLVEGRLHVVVLHPVQGAVELMLGKSGRIAFGHAFDAHRETFRAESEPSCAQAFENRADAVSNAGTVLSNALWSPARRTRHFVGHGGSVALGDVLVRYGVLEVEGKSEGAPQMCFIAHCAKMLSEGGNLCAHTFPLPGSFPIV